MKSRDPKLARTAARTAEAIKQAKSEAVVREHGTESEQSSLMFSGLMTGGVKLTELAAAAQGNGTVELGAPDPELLAKLALRGERRAKLKLPKAECAADPPAPSCLCLERALDQPGDDGARAVRKLAAAFHQRPRREPEPTPDPQEASAEPPAPTESLEEPPVEPSPAPKPEPTPRVVYRSRRWYDDFERPHFSDRKF